MGASESRLQGSPKDALGLHVLRVAEGSPAADAGLEVWFEYIVGVNGQRVVEDTDPFTETIERSENRRVTLQVWSSKRQELRDVDIVPSRSWSTGSPALSIATATPASPSEAEDPSLLGVSLRLCKVDAALDRVWHVLDVLDGSPAQDAGLVPFTDYIVGCAAGVLRHEGDFYALVESNVDKPLRLFCWNADLDVLRQVIIVPNRSWGNGQSLLGCGIGFGLLHRIPKPSDRPAVLEELDLEEDDEVPLHAHSDRRDKGEEDEDEYTQGVSVVPVDDSDRTLTRPPAAPRYSRPAIMEEA